MDIQPNRYYLVKTGVGKRTYKNYPWKLVTAFVSDQWGGTVHYLNVDADGKILPRKRRQATKNFIILEGPYTKAEFRR